MRTASRPCFESQRRPIRNRCERQCTEPGQKLLTGSNQPVNLRIGLKPPRANLGRFVSYLLLADDNEEMRLMLRDLFRSAGHEVDLVEDGHAVLASIQVREPDLVIL